MKKEGQLRGGPGEGSVCLCRGWVRIYTIICQLTDLLDDTHPTSSSRVRWPWIRHPGKKCLLVSIDDDDDGV